MNYECSTFCTHKIFYLFFYILWVNLFPCKTSGYVRYMVDEATLSIGKSKQKEVAWIVSDNLFLCFEIQSYVNSLLVLS